MVRPAPIDPPVISAALWSGFTGRTGFDVGTNVGQSLPEMARRFEIVVGFEPFYASWQQAERGFAPMEILNLAVSDHDGEVDLALVAGEQTETGQLGTPGTHGMAPGPEAWQDPRVTRFTVPCKTMDTLASEYGRPDFAKVDTEGHELAVLQGAAGCMPMSWLVEFHNPELYAACKDLLEWSGHEVETVRHPHYAPGSDLWHSHGWLRAWPRYGHAV